MKQLVTLCPQPEDEINKYLYATQITFYTYNVHDPNNEWCHSQRADLSSSVDAIKTILSGNDQRPHLPWLPASQGILDSVNLTINTNIHNQEPFYLEENFHLPTSEFISSLFLPVCTLLQNHIDSYLIRRGEEFTSPLVAHLKHN